MASDLQSCTVPRREWRLAMQSERPPTIRVQTLHKRTCADWKQGNSFRGCDCPKWLYYPDEQRYVDAGTTQWKIAERQRQDILDSYDPVKRETAELRAKKETMAVLTSEIRRLRTAIDQMNRADSRFWKVGIREPEAYRSEADYRSDWNQD